MDFVPLGVVPLPTTPRPRSNSVSAVATLERCWEESGAESKALGFSLQLPVAPPGESQSSCRSANIQASLCPGASPTVDGVASLSRRKPLSSLREKETCASQTHATEPTDIRDVAEPRLETLQT